MASTTEKLLHTNNVEGKPRRFGFEIEYAGLSLDEAAEIVTELYGGEVQPEHSARMRIEGSSLGEFVLELDAIPLQNIAAESHKLKDSERLGDRLQHQLSETIGQVGAKITPYEIICPPVTGEEIAELEKLCNKLREAGAKGTKAGLHYAFGLHINAELSSLEPEFILHHLQSFLLLSPWLIKEHAIDISRRMTNFIDPFPASYLKLLLDDGYAPDLTSLIDDYHQHNPTRNRALDMLPLFAHLQAEQVEKLYGTEEKINPRPTFHYRLPNCEIGQKDWGLKLELERWFMVEKVAQDAQMLGKLMAAWQKHQSQWLSMDAKWVQTLEGILEGYDG